MSKQEADNETLVREVQEYLKRKGLYQGNVDAWAGKGTLEAWRTIGGTPKAAQEAPRGVSGWPGRRQADLRAFYGEPGTGIVQVELPFPMRLAWDLDTVVKRQPCHRLVKDSLQAVLESLLNWYGPDGLRELGLDLLGGIYNLRRMRDGKEWSVHAYGAAIDLNPSKNGLHTAWPSEAVMPVKVIELFEAAGWTSLARVIGRDAMHFQATSWE